MREEILKELLDLIELYLCLDCRVKTGSVVEIHKDVIADPTGDLVSLRDDIWNRIISTSQNLHAL